MHELTKLIRDDMVPALGVTEPGPIAFCVAKARTLIDSRHGINGETPEQTMRNMGLIASPGMVMTEETIVGIQESKSSQTQREGHVEVSLRHALFTIFPFSFPAG